MRGATAPCGAEPFVSRPQPALGWHARAGRADTRRPQDFPAARARERPICPSRLRAEHTAWGDSLFVFLVGPGQAKHASWRRASHRPRDASARGWSFPCGQRAIDGRFDAASPPASHPRGCRRGASCPLHRDGRSAAAGSAAQLARLTPCPSAPRAAQRHRQPPRAQPLARRRRGGWWRAPPRRTRA